MKSSVLFRAELAEEDELEICRHHVDTYTSRTLVPPGMGVGRFSVLPFYRELEADLRTRGAQLVNSYDEHRFVADIGQWYPLLSDVTFPTWSSIADVPDSGFPVVLKGETNSRKQAWDRSMYCETRPQAIEALVALQTDALIGQQHIYARLFMPLRCAAERILSTYPPVSEEYRYFVLDGQILSGGFYWSDAADRLRITVDSNAPDLLKLVHTVINRVGQRCRFMAVDVGRLEDGQPILIELNDAQMAGLSCNSADLLYRNLALQLASYGLD